MTLETAAVAVGKALGAHLAQAWLAGRSARQERGKDLAELIQTRFPDRIARRRFERQVADVADQVAERLLTMCGHEYGGLRGNEKGPAPPGGKKNPTQADPSPPAPFEPGFGPGRPPPTVPARLGP